MRYILGFFFILTTGLCLAQRSEISLSFSKGGATSNYARGAANMYNRLDYKNAKNVSESAYNLRYSFSVNPKAKNQLRIGTGVSYTNSIYSQNITDYKYDYLLDHIDFHYNQINIPLSLGIERGLYNDNVFIELQFMVVENIPTQKKLTYIGSAQKKYDFIDYKYTLNTNYLNSVSGSISCTSKFKINKQLFGSFSINYLKSKIISYNYNYNTTYYMLNLNTGATTTEYYSHQSLTNINLVDSYFYFSLGLCYKLGKQVVVGTP